MIRIEEEHIHNSELNPPSKNCAFTHLHEYRIEKIEELIIKNQEDMRNQLNRIEKQLEHFQRTQEQTAKDMIEHNLRIEYLETKFKRQERFIYLISSAVITQLVILFLPRIIQ